MSGSFRLGIVGAGKISAQSHLPAAIAMPNVDVTAVVDTSGTRAGEVVSRLGIRPRVAESVNDVLSSVDAVLIATPNFTHAELAIQCLDAGVHVLVEKPLANTVEEGEEIAAAAQRNSRVAAVGYCTRFSEAVRLMRTLLDRQFFGQIHRFAYQYGVVGGWASESGFHLDRGASGGGVLVTTGTHFLDRMLYWFGYPESCALQDDSLGGPEANAVASFRWGSLEGSARFSKTVKLPGGFVMKTDRGTVVLSEGERETICLRSEEYPEVEHQLVPPNRVSLPQRGVFCLQLEDFVRACREGGEPLVTTREGIEAVRIAQDLYAARTELASSGSGKRE